MFSGLLLIAATAWAACPQTTFEFHGQPECIELAYAHGRITLDNQCDHLLLVDQSLQLENTSPGFIAPHTTTQIRDLSFFTVGMNGSLYEVVASIAQATACEEPDTTDERLATKSVTPR